MIYHKAQAIAVCGGGGGAGTNGAGGFGGGINIPKEIMVWKKCWYWWS